MTTEEFIRKMSDYYSEDLTPIFKKYVYSQRKIERANKDTQTPNAAPRGRVHMKMSIGEMAKYL